MTPDYADFVAIGFDTIIIFGELDGVKFEKRLSKAEADKVFALDAKQQEQRRKLIFELAA